MATQTAVLSAIADIDALCTALESEANISDAVVVPPYESDNLTNPGSTRDNGVVSILITGTADSDITAAIAAVGSLRKVTNALASSDAET
jgi:hypothetical protein